MSPHEYATWPAQSRGLAEARIILEREPHTYGIPLSQATDGEFDGWFKVDLGTNYVEKAVAEARDARKDKHLIVTSVQLDPKYKPRQRGKKPKPEAS